MNNKLKYTIPFALVTAVVFTSCNHNNSQDVNIPPLNRITYDVANTFTSLNSVFKKIYAKQFKSEEASTNAEGVFQIFPKGTVNVKYKMKISGSVLADYYPSTGTPPIVINNLDAFFNDDISISWDASDASSSYMKISNKNGSFYVGRESPQNGKYVWYRYFNTPINDTKYKIRIDSPLSDIANSDFRNFILRESCNNMSFPIESHGFDMASFMGEGRVGFDLSGFLSDGLPYDEYTNVLSPGSIGIDPETTGTIDNTLALEVIDGLSMNFGSNDDKTALFSAKVNNLDLGVWAPLTEIFRELTVAGKMDFDYFVAYADSFIKQQEIGIKLKDVDIMGAVYDEYVFRAGVVEVSKLNLDLFANEEVTQECERDSFDPTEYKEIWE